MAFRGEFGVFKLFQWVLLRVITRSYKAQHLCLNQVWKIALWFHLEFTLNFLDYLIVLAELVPQTLLVGGNLSYSCISLEFTASSCCASLTSRCNYHRLVEHAWLWGLCGFTRCWALLSVGIEHRIIDTRIEFRVSTFLVEHGVVLEFGACWAFFAASWLHLLKQCLSICLPLTRSICGFNSDRCGLRVKVTALDWWLNFWLNHHSLRLVPLRSLTRCSLWILRLNCNVCTSYWLVLKVFVKDHILSVRLKLTLISNFGEGNLLFVFLWAQNIFIESWSRPFNLVFTWLPFWEILLF